MCFSRWVPHGWLAVEGRVAPAIRRHHRLGKSLRAPRRTRNVTWRTVRRALDGQWPQPRKKQRRKESRLDPYKSLFDGMLRADLDATPNSGTLPSAPMTAWSGPAH